MPISKTLKIFLLDGLPTGTKIVELSNWSGKAYVIPRNRLSKLLERKELETQAVYFMIGDAELTRKRVYIGKTENFKNRILQHSRKYEFWNIVICFISKDDNLTGAHISFLESKIIELALMSDRAEIKNTNRNIIASLPEPDVAEMEEFMRNMKMVISALGFTFLEDISIKNEGQEKVYYVEGRSGNGIVKITDEGYVLQKGSIISSKDSKSLSGTNVSVMRCQYCHSNKVKKTKDGNFKTLDNLVFSSPSYVATFVIGNSVKR